MSEPIWVRGGLYDAEAARRADARPAADRRDAMSKPEATEVSWREPRITINGIALTTAQAMTLRVALQTFAIGLQDGLGDDETGKALANGYIAAICAINGMMLL